VAGLVYEVLWTRYLGLYVGHGVYAQVLVLGVYLGGMAVGSFVVADLSPRIARPLLWYAGAEALLASFGLFFHPLYLTVTDLSYGVIFPAVGSAGLVGSLRWAIAGSLILPQAMILGATFPLMAASLVRADAGRPGRGIARVYLLNTLGGAAGVLLAGFWLIGAFGLPGTSVAAAMVNLLAAALALRVQRRIPPVATTSGDAAVEPPLGHQPHDVATGRGLVAMVLVVSFGTALASFAYEIGWIRMLSLVLGSATHSFELMLSAFILGLALGSWWVSRRADPARDPIGFLGVVQVAMGIAALASVPLFYWVSFDAMAWLMGTLPGRPAGYPLFGFARFALSLMVMLPATMLAGMTVPLLTLTLLRRSGSESAIGRVYGLNTLGSVAGAGLGGLVALPWLGLKGVILAGAALDIVLGLWLLDRSARWRGARPRAVALVALASAAAFAAVGFGVTLDQIVMGSGVYRYGDLPAEGDRIGLYYADGRTATVSAHVGAQDGIIALSTNGKPDASLDPRWLGDRGDSLPVRPLDEGMDFTTQVLAPAVALAHNPRARNVANIGHGSGLSATAFLTSSELQRVVTIEIEPFMVQGSMVFLPANAPALFDPRSSYVFDDAKSYFAYQSERFDVVFAEPSNPWVSGTADLFTVEFYEQVSRFLAPGGVLAQWMQIYELTDDLFLSVVAALDTVFPAYRAYLVGDNDVAIVAGTGEELREPDWSVLASASFTQLTSGIPPFRPEHMAPLLLFDETTFRPLLDQGVTTNSDFRPVLDLGAERARFEGSRADGLYSFGVSRVDLARLLRDERVAPLDYHLVPARGLTPALLWGRAAWLRSVRAAGGGIAPAEYPGWQGALVGMQSFLVRTRQADPAASWQTWATAFAMTEADIHWGTIGWVDSTFYREVYDFLDRTDAPPAARATVDLMHGLSRLEWDRVASAADVLVFRVAVGEAWVDPGLLLDAAVLAYVRTGRPEAARDALDALEPRAARAPGNLRDRLLHALVTESETAASGGN
jgi:predicted membrane-bound spermidine synthase